MENSSIQGRSYKKRGSMKASSDVALELAGVGSLEEEVNTKPLFSDFFKKEREVKERHFHIVLDAESSSRLDKIRTQIYPSTQKAVIEMSLQLLETMLAEHNEGSTFYIRRKGGTIEPYDLF